MKIVHVIPSLKKPGGAESFCVNLAIALSKLNYEVIIITLYKEINFYKEKLQKNKIAYYCLNKHKGLDIINSVKLRKLIKKIQPDIIHSHLSTYLSFFVGMVMKNKKIVFIHTIHSSLSKEKPMRKINYWIMKKYERSNLMHHIAISPEVKKYFLNYTNLNKEIPIIYNGLPVNEFLNRGSLFSRKKDFICIANFIPIKNHLTLLKSFQKVILKKPNTNLTLVGYGTLQNEIKEAIFTLGLSNNVEFLGERNDISSLLSDHKYFILPSHSEGNPISVLEAMAAGLVILVTKYGGTKDIIINMKNGYLLDPFSQEQITNTMLMCLNNNEINNEIQKNNLSKIMEYDISETAKQHIKLYEQKLKSKF